MTFVRMDIRLRFIKIVTLWDKIDGYCTADTRLAWSGNLWVRKYTCVERAPDHDGSLFQVIIATLVAALNAGIRYFVTV